MFMRYEYIIIMRVKGKAGVCEASESPQAVLRLLKINRDYGTIDTPPNGFASLQSGVRKKISISTQEIYAHSNRT